MDRDLCALLDEMVTDGLSGSYIIGSQPTAVVGIFTACATAEALDECGTAPMESVASSPGCPNSPAPMTDHYEWHMEQSWYPAGGSSSPLRDELDDLLEEIANDTSCPYLCQLTVPNLLAASPLPRICGSPHDPSHQQQRQQQQQQQPSARSSQLPMQPQPETCIPAWPQGPAPAQPSSPFPRVCTGAGSPDAGTLAPAAQMAPGHAPAMADDRTLTGRPLAGVQPSRSSHAACDTALITGGVPVARCSSGADPRADMMGSGSATPRWDDDRAVMCLAGASLEPQKAAGQFLVVNPRALLAGPGQQQRGATWTGLCCPAGPEGPTTGSEDSRPWVSAPAGAVREPGAAPAPIRARSAGENQSQWMSKSFRRLRAIMARPTGRPRPASSEPPLPPPPHGSGRQLPAPKPGTGCGEADCSGDDIAGDQGRRACASAAAAENAAGQVTGEAFKSQVRQLAQRLRGLSQTGDRSRRKEKVLQS